jgi:hypothetical protein
MARGSFPQCSFPVIRIHPVIRKAQSPSSGFTQWSEISFSFIRIHPVVRNPCTFPSSGFTQWSEIPFSVFRILLVVTDPHIGHQNYSVVRDPLLSHQDSPSSQRSPSLSSGFSWWSQIPILDIRITQWSEIPFSVIRIRPVVRDPLLCHQDSPGGHRSPSPSLGFTQCQRSPSPSSGFT